MLPEKPKRLTPKILVLRELYLKSGNQCAISGCGKLMINADGIFIGEICHIEAALQDGQRFNAVQTNEERRGINNLTLLIDFRISLILSNIIYIAVIKLDFLHTVPQFPSNNCHSHCLSSIFYSCFLL